MRTMLMALVAVAVVAVLLLDRPAGADRVPSVVRARTIELVDGRGQVRAQIKVERPSREVGRDGSGLLLANEATEPGIHALAGAKQTSLTLQRGEQRNVLVP